MTLEFHNSHCQFLMFLHVLYVWLGYSILNLYIYNHQSEQFNVVFSKTEQQKYVWFKQYLILKKAIFPKAMGLSREIFKFLNFKLNKKPRT